MPPRGFSTIIPLPDRLIKHNRRGAAYIKGRRGIHGDG